MSDTDYNAEVLDDATDALSHFRDDILEFLVDEGEANKCIREYPSGDSYHHETHVDEAYDVAEATKLLSDLSEHEETDSGLWEGQDWEQVLSTKAAFTYGNAVYWKFHELIDELNDKYESAVDDEDIPDDEVEPSEERRKELAEAAFEEIMDENTPDDPDESTFSLTLSVDFTVKKTDGEDFDLAALQKAEQAIQDLLRSAVDGSFKGNAHLDYLILDEFNVTAGSVWKAS